MAELDEDFSLLRFVFCEVNAAQMRGEGTPTQEGSHPSIHVSTSGGPWGGGPWGGGRGAAWTPHG